MTTETRRDPNWTAVAIAGAAVGGIYLISRIARTIGEGSEADRELAREIMADWYDEFVYLQYYTELIYHGGREPTEQELSIIAAALNQMTIKEQTIYELSKSVWQEMRELLDTVATNWWLLPVAGFGWVPAYATYKLVKMWKDRNQPPPNFPCPHGDFVAGTKGALKHHMDTVHPVVLDYMTEAQVDFVKLNTWVQSAVAVETFYHQIHSNWRAWSPASLLTLRSDVVNTGILGIGSSLILYRVAFWMVGIPI